MDIGPGGDRPKWIAREFEQVVEQLEGCDLQTCAVQRTLDTWLLGQRMIETARALRAAEMVHQGMRVKRERPDNFVE